MDRNRGFDPTRMERMRHTLGPPIGGLRLATETAAAGGIARSAQEAPNLKMSIRFTHKEWGFHGEKNGNASPDHGNTSRNAVFFSLQMWNSAAKLEDFRKKLWVSKQEMMGISHNEHGDFYKRWGLKQSKSIVCHEERFSNALGGMRMSPYVDGDLASKHVKLTRKHTDWSWFKGPQFLGFDSNHRIFMKHLWITGMGQQIGSTWLGTSKQAKL